MSDEIIKINASATAPADLAWRGAALAELAFARVPGLVVNKHLTGPGDGLPYDYLVATAEGGSFFVKAEAFSASRLDEREEAEAVDAAGGWRRRVEAGIVRRAQASGRPFYLFLFDADTDHGRYLRLDTLAHPAPNAKTVDVYLPREDAIDGQGLGRIAAAPGPARDAE